MVAPITDVWETGKISSYTPNIAVYLPQRGEIVYFDSNNDTQDSVLQSMRMREFLVFNAKLGSKIVFGKYFSLQPYAIVGGAEYRHTFNQFKIFENSKTKLQTKHMIVKIGYYFL